MKIREHKSSNENVEEGTIIYSLNNNDKTAIIIGNKSTPNEIIIIPRAINYKSHEYVIISISRYAFQNSKIKAIQFSSDSELKEIEQFAFWKSSIENFTIPPHLTTICKSSFAKCEHLKTIEIPPNSELKTINECAFWNSSIDSFLISSNLIELKEDWCSGANNLNVIKVDPNNPRYKSYDEDKIIIGKESLESNNYDNLVFCVRNATTKIKIPNFIKQIEPHAFCKCKRIQTIEVEQNSILQTIKRDAFYCSSIECLSIPSTVVDLKEGWCSGTENLNFIKIDPKNKRYSFFDNNFIIDNENDVLVFCIRNVKIVTVPSFIKVIGPFAFENCKKLSKIEIVKDSQLETIEKFAFFNSAIERFIIPLNLKKICESAFSSCDNLCNVKVPENSKLQIIEKNVFWLSKIECFSIPPHLKKIDESAFLWCNSMKIIEFNENSKIELIAQNVLSNLRDVIIMIPSKLRDSFIKLNIKKKKTFY